MGGWIQPQEFHHQAILTWKARTIRNVPPTTPGMAHTQMYARLMPGMEWFAISAQPKMMARAAVSRINSGVFGAAIRLTVANDIVAMIAEIATTN